MVFNVACECINLLKLRCRYPVMAKKSGTGAELAHVGSVYLSKFTDKTPKEDVPLALILGWLGSEIQSLKRYVQLYRDRGHRVLVYSAMNNQFVAAEDVLLEKVQPLAGLLDSFECLIPGEPVTAKETGKALLAKEMAAALAPMSAVRKAGKAKTVTVHLFSNGGAHSLYLLLKSLTLQRKRLLLHSLVIDSAPGTPSVSTGVRAMTLHMDKSSTRYYVTWLLLTVGTHVSRMLDVALGRLSLSDKYHAAVLSKSADDGEHDAAPRLFLYSRADDLVDYRDVERAVEDARKHGVPVKAHSWPDSAHVQHMKQHSKEYTALIEGNLGSATTTSSKL